MRLYRFIRILNEMDRNPHIQDDPHASIFLNSYDKRRSEVKRPVSVRTRRTEFTHGYQDMLFHARRANSVARTYMKKGW